MKSYVVRNSIKLIVIVQFFRDELFFEGRFGVSVYSEVLEAF